MSVQNLYIIFDMLAQAVIGSIMVLPNDAVARRVFQDTLTSGKTPMSDHPSDFVLYCVGSIDLKTGEITGVVGGVVDADQIISADAILERLRRDRETLKEASNG